MPKFNNVELTEQTILATRKHFADNCQACIDEVEAGTQKVNEPVSYIKWRRDQAADWLGGQFDHTFTFLQRAYWIQTGEMVALLP